jgi:hypothetical protein
MGISVVWDNAEKTVIRYVFNGSWNWHDFRTAVASSDLMLDTVTHITDFILDVTYGAGGVPQNALMNMHAIFDNLHPRVGRIVFAGRDCRSGSVIAMKHLLCSLSRLYDIHFEMRFADNLLDARRMLRDTRLPAFNS